jgi:putative membrane protein
MEYFIMSKVITKKWVAYVSAFAIIGAVSAIYEDIEWIYAVKDGGTAGVAFLGSQGDVWDAQKDMFMDMCGALSALFLYFVATFRKKASK